MHVKSVENLFILLFAAIFGNFFSISGLKILDTSRQIQAPKSQLSLDVWKYEGEEPHLHKIWKTVTLKIAFKNGDLASKSDENYVIYQNQNLSELTQAYEDGQKLFGFLQKWTLWRSTQIYPFSSTFIGIETLKLYEIGLNVHHVDFILLFLFLLGIFLFFYAKKLSRNVLAYYAGSTGVGILLSLLFILFLFYRFLPQKRTVAFLSIFTGAISFNLYIVFTIWQNLFTIFKRYQRFVAIYLVTVGSLSFALCYRFGPPKDIKSQNLIQWLIQTVGLLLLYNSCQIPSISCFIIISLIITYNFQRPVVKFIFRIRFRYFPPAKKLLTEEEYLKEGVVETKKALAELRSFCRSPQCDAWKYTSRLSTPKRFASFISGDSHLSDDELLQHDSYVAAADVHFSDEDDEDLGDDDVIRSPTNPANLGLDDTSSSSFAYLRSPARKNQVLASNSAANGPNFSSRFAYSPEFYRQFSERMHSIEKRPTNERISSAKK